MSWAGGYSVLDRVEHGSAVRALEPALSEAVDAAYLVEGEGVLDPMLFIRSLGARLRAQGVRILERAPATQLCRDGRRVRSVIAGDTELECSSVLIAAGVWSTEERLRG